MGVERIILDQEFKNDLIVAYNELLLIDENKINDWDIVNRLRSAKDCLGKYVSQDDEIKDLPVERVIVAMDRQELVRRQGSFGYEEQTIGYKDPAEIQKAINNREHNTYYDKYGNGYTIAEVVSNMI